jgi:hypothetical protein
LSILLEVVDDSAPSNTSSQADMKPLLRGN